MLLGIDLIALSHSKDSSDEQFLKTEVPIDVTCEILLTVLREVQPENIPFGMPVILEFHVKLSRFTQLANTYSFPNVVTVSGKTKFVKPVPLNP